MFIDCPYCGFLVALGNDGKPLPRCPNCAQRLRDDPAADAQDAEIGTMAQAADAMSTTAPPGAISSPDGAATAAAPAAHDIEAPTAARVSEAADASTDTGADAPSAPAAMATPPGTTPTAGDHEAQDDRPPASTRTRQAAGEEEADAAAGGAPARPPGPPAVSPHPVPPSSPAEPTVSPLGTVDAGTAPRESRPAIGTPDATGAVGSGAMAPGTTAAQVTALAKAPETGAGATPDAIPAARDASAADATGGFPVMGARPDAAARPAAELPTATPRASASGIAAPAVPASASGPLAGDAPAPLLPAAPSGDRQEPDAPSTIATASPTAEAGAGAETAPGADAQTADAAVATDVPPRAPSAVDAEAADPAADAPAAVAVVDADAQAAAAADDATEVPTAVATPARPRRTRSAALPSFARVAPAVPVDRKRLRWELAAIAALCLLLALQLLLSQRARLAEDAQWRPLLSTLCGALRCTLPPWREPDAFRVLERDVRAQASGVLRVSARIRNDARWAQPWPTLRLTLSDADGRAVAARVFQPREYLGGAPTQPRLGSGQSAALRMDIVEPGSQAVAFTFDFR